MKQYLDMIRHIAENGTMKSDRTGTGTVSVFGYQMRFDLAKGFPVLTTKAVHMKSVIAELLWFLSGSTNVKDLQKMGCTIWDEWADPQTGELGPVYGSQWRSWPAYDGSYLDQIKTVVEDIKRTPDSRRLLVCSWNVAQIGRMKLPPCHCLFQFYVAPLSLQERLDIHAKRMAAGDYTNTGHTESMEEHLDNQGVPRGKLSCQLYQRSADTFLGVPFNIASYALLTHMIAQQCDLEVGEFIWTGGDCHIYTNHFDQCETQLGRDPLPLPKLVIQRKPDSIFDYQPSDFTLEGYNPHPTIKAPVAI